MIHGHPYKQYQRYALPGFLPFSLEKKKDYFDFFKSSFNSLIYLI